MCGDSSRFHFAPRLIQWQKQHGRHDLPWQNTTDPYRIWLSEIMLQQTQVDSVIPYYTRFLLRFPDIAGLACANVDEVMTLWAGLGYYSRARNLHAAAKIIQQQRGGHFPRQFDDLVALPGVGRSTAAAIAALAYGDKLAILDGNVKRVLSRIFAIEGWPGDKTIENRLWSLANTLLPDTEMGPYTQGLMDLGATCCTRHRPRCDHCPFEQSCQAHQQGRENELPWPRPRRVLPDKHINMLILLDGANVCLEKRPATGIWGGLWSLPECAGNSEPSAEVQSMGYEIRTLKAQQKRTHVFTHFRLHIQPWQVEVQPLWRLNEAGKIWLPLDALKQLALPAPVAVILRELGMSQLGLGTH